MRNVILKKGKRTSFPWGPASSVNGEQYLPAAQAFNADGKAFGCTYSIEKMKALGQELAPEWFEKDPELTAREVRDRLNEGGANAQMGPNQFFLHWHPTQRVWEVFDASDRYDRTDAAETLGKAATNIRKGVLRVYQMATHVIESLDDEQQEAHVAEFHRVMAELDIIEDWGKHQLRTLVDSAIRAQNGALGNGDLLKLKK
jgi:hypothetical protein